MQLPPAFQSLFSFEESISMDFDVRQPQKYRVPYHLKFQQMTAKIIT